MLLGSLVAGALDQAITLSLIFGGCCSNALTLQVITSQYPPAGSLLTLAQFLSVALASLWKQLLLIPRPLPRHQILKHIINIAREKEAHSILLLHNGSDQTLSRLFLQDLAHQAGAIPDLKEQSLRLPPLLSSTHAHTQVQDAATLRVALVRGTNLPPDAHIVVDITKVDNPRLLNPRLEPISFNPFRYRLKPRSIPLFRYAFQVLLFLLISLLNNAAFAYHVPMPVHIIFRSGGLVVNMLLGWLLKKRRYTALQVYSVLLVTFGVMLTTLSSMRPKSSAQSTTGIPEIEEINYGKYAVGIGMLSAALVMAGILGLDQDSVFERYGRGHWEESMFYLHALSLPLFAFTAKEIMEQVRVVNMGPRVEVLGPLSLLRSGASNATTGVGGVLLRPLPFAIPFPFKFPFSFPFPVTIPATVRFLPTLRIPAFYIPLAANVLTQLFCVAGVNRLTARANSLTVSLVLVVRKAVSLVLSVLVLGTGGGNEEGKGTGTGMMVLWMGAAAVLVGTIGYTIGSRTSKVKVKVKQQ